MSITLREITQDNFFECIKLKVAESQEKYVAHNMYSLAESKVFTYLIPLAVYNDDEMVGFSLHGKDPDDGKYWIVRLMIGERFQGKGYGKQSTLELIKQMSQYGDCDEIFLDYVKGNIGAEKLYEKIGFKPTGETDKDGNIIMSYDLKNNANHKKISNN